MSEKIISPLFPSDGELQDSTPKPWESRIEAIKENSEENLDQILNDIVPNISFSEEDIAEIENNRNTLGITINCRAHITIPELLQTGRIHSGVEGHKFGGKFLKLLDFGGYRLRQKVEKALGIKPRGTPDDPELIYGAAVHDTAKDLEGGTGGWFGDTVIVLNTERVKDRTTFTPGDSFYQKEKNHRIVTWEWVPVLKFIRDKIVGDYVEAQIAGGVTTEDITEIRFKADSVEQFRRILDQLGGVEAIHKKMPWLRLTYTGQFRDRGSGTHAQ